MRPTRTRLLLASSVVALGVTIGVDEARESGRIGRLLREGRRVQGSARITGCSISYDDEGAPEGYSCEWLYLTEEREAHLVGSTWSRELLPVGSRTPVDLIYLPANPAEWEQYSPWLENRTHLREQLLTCVVVFGLLALAILFVPA